MWLIEGCVTACTHFAAMSSHLAVLQLFLAVYLVCFSFLFCRASGLSGFFWLLLFPNRINSVTSFSPHLHKHLGWHNVGNGAEAGTQPKGRCGKEWSVFIKFYYQIWVQLQSCSTGVAIKVFVQSHCQPLWCPAVCSAVIRYVTWWFLSRSDSEVIQRRAGNRECCWGWRTRTPPAAWGLSPKCE